MPATGAGKVFMPQDTTCSGHLRQMDTPILTISGVELTDTGFGHLGRMKTLKGVTLPGCGVTVERARQLQKMLPDGCNISGVGGYRSPN